MIDLALGDLTHFSGCAPGFSLRCVTLLIFGTYSERSIIASLMGTL